MDVIDYELKRYEQMKIDFDTKKHYEIKMSEGPAGDAIDTLDSVEKPQEVCYQIII